MIFACAAIDSLLRFLLLIRMFRRHLPDTYYHMPQAVQRAMQVPSLAMIFSRLFIGF